MPFTYYFICRFMKKNYVKIYKIQMFNFLSKPKKICFLKKMKYFFKNKLKILKYKLYNEHHIKYRDRNRY